MARLFSSRSFDDRIRSVLTSRPDLLLYELYQRLQLSLPPGGLTYEFSHVLPPQRSQPYDHDETQVASVLSESKAPGKTADLIAKYTRRLLRDATVMACCEATLNAINGVGGSSEKSVLTEARQWEPRYRIDETLPGGDWRIKEAVSQLKAMPTILNSSGGVVRASSLAASKLTREFNKKVFWIELQDYPDVDSLLRDFLRSLALRCGQFQAKHVTLHPVSEGFQESDHNDAVDGFLKRVVSHIKSALEEYRTDPGSVAVFLSGRDSYGCASGTVSTPWTDEVEFRRLHVFIEALGRVGIPTAYFPCSKERSDRKLNLIRSPKVHGGLDLEATSLASEVPPLAKAWPSDPIAERLFQSGDRQPVEEIAADLSVFNDILKEALGDFFDISKMRDGTLNFVLKNDISIETFKKMEFLYALTLFRHSRHTNAIAAEGAFSCPHRFQTRAVDNDFVRALQVDRWTEELCRARVFFTKPGGALWMHRDIREAIHSVLGRTDISKIQFPGRRHSDFRETRGRTHFWIGEWYHKAFCSSGHLTPVIESVYHLVSSAIYSQFALPKLNPGEKLTKTQWVRYRCMMFESAVAQASKTLLLSWRFIELWQASSAKVAWLDKPQRDKIMKALNSVIKKIDPDKAHREKLNRCKDQFEAIHKALHNAVVLEGGRCERGSTSWSTPDSIVMRLADGTDQTAPETLAHGIDVIRKPEEEFWKEVREPLKTRASARLWEVLLAVGRGEAGSRQFGEAKANWKAGATTSQIQNLIWFLGEASFVVLRRAKLQFHSTGFIDNRSWLISTLCCNLGIDLCKHLPAWNLEYEINSKIKMHSIYSVGLANLGRFFEANRHLNEAQGLLSKWQHGTPEDQAIISIRRAEVKLTECFWISRLLEANLDFSRHGIVRVRGKNRVGNSVNRQYATPSFREGAVLCWSLNSMNYVLDSTDASDKVLPPNIFEALRRSRPVGFDPASKDACERWATDARANLRKVFSAILDEAVRSLEIAEKNLGGSSQSSLWWSRLHTLRMRIYGLLDQLPEDAELCIIFRKQSADNGIFKNFLSAKRIAGEDDFRRLRALKYFLPANRWYCRYRAPELFNKEDGTAKGGVAVYEKFLPDSVKTAKELALELWTANEGSGKKDLLRMAIVRCFKDFSEVDPRPTDSRR